jgi:hypothetical protein
VLVGPFLPTRPFLLRNFNKRFNTIMFSKYF